MHPYPFKQRCPPIVQVSTSWEAGLAGPRQNGLSAELLGLKTSGWEGARSGQLQNMPMALMMI